MKTILIIWALNTTTPTAIEYPSMYACQAAMDIIAKAYDGKAMLACTYKLVNTTKKG